MSIGSRARGRVGTSILQASYCEQVFYSKIRGTSTHMALSDSSATWTDQEISISDMESRSCREKLELHVKIALKRWRRCNATGSSVPTYHKLPLVFHF